jgi:molybdate transport system substrate-binding protein
MLRRPIRFRTRSKARPRGAAAPGAAAALAAVACGVGGGGAESRLLVAAAADLALAMPELVAAFSAETGAPVDVTLGSSGQIAHQILHGAPVDLFLSADAGWVDRLRAAGRTLPETEAVYAIGPLVLVSAGTVPTIRSVAELDHTSVRRIAIANPEHAPYGRAARQALDNAGLWDALEPRLVIAENVRQTLQYVEARSVDVAISARSLMGEGTPGWVAVPADLHDPLHQTLAVIAGRPRESEARAFAAFLVGPAGRQILARHGFLLPERTVAP